MRRNTRDRRSWIHPARRFFRSPSGASRRAYNFGLDVGQWSGPEGTFLRIASRGGVYEVTIQDLDAPRTFAGRAEADGIAIERDGRRERLHATDGPGTGMKWLADKHDCLGLRPNEGWCRD